MTRTGMTLLEMLLALVFLSAIVAATASWTSVAGTLISPQGMVERQHWVIAANSVLDVIEQDFQVGDSDASSAQVSRTSGVHPRVSVNANRLSITTRIPDGGAVHHEFGLDANVGLLTVTELVRDAKQTRMLLDQTQSWQCQLDLEHKVLEVSIDRTDGTTVRRRYRLP